MRPLKHVCAALCMALCLSASLLPAAPSAQATALPILTGQKTDEPNETLIEQIRATYKSAKKRARLKSFKGRCGKYVNHQLVVLGINKTYICANGNREYDIYSKKATTSGGMCVSAYPAKKYTLKTALEAIARSDPNARNILIGFERGTSKAGKRYGHTLLIHGIENGSVYFSDSYAQTVNGKRYKEGEPIVCSVDMFALLYRKYKLDGVIWFHCTRSFAKNHRSVVRRGVFLSPYASN